MELLMTLAIILGVGTLNIACFSIGLKAGKGEQIKAVSLPNPIKAIKEHVVERESKKEAEKEQAYIDTIMQNIERYDGTAQGQKDVSR